MALRQQVLDAFATLGVDPDADLATATQAYKRQALLHHPDRNHGDPGATQRFQQIGAAWDICQRHFDNPAWSRSPAFDDDDIPLDEDALYEFYMFMFSETLFGRYSRARGQRYRYEHSRHAGGYFTVFFDPEDSQERHARNIERQKKESEEYEKRLKELETEIEEEKREREREAKQRQAESNRRANVIDLAFQAVYAGDSSAAKKYILENDLDVNTPRKRPKQASSESLQFDSLLHVAACRCDEAFVMFLLERGAKHTALNKSQLTPFHAAIKAGNTKMVKFIMEHGRSFEGYHPSKAAPSGSTPLQLAVESGVPSMVELLVKHATTHDVEKCWKQDNLSEEIREVLLTKKGFVPPETGLTPAAKKALKQQELAQQKESRIAEEQERARINRLKREERAAKKAEREAALKAESQNRVQPEVVNEPPVGRKEEEVKTDTQPKEEDSKLAEKGTLGDLQQEPRNVASGVVRPEDRPSDETSVDVKLQDPTNERQADGPDEMSVAAKVENVDTPMKEERAKTETRPEAPRGQTAKPTSRPLPPKNVKKTKTKVAAKNVEEMDERERQKYEAKMRRRAEQSARDKERHRRKMEERARTKAPAEVQAPPAYVQYTMPIEDIQTCIVPDDLFRDDERTMCR